MKKKPKRLQKKIAKNQFDFNDFISQIQQIKKMGNLKELASMIPGVGKALKDIDIDDNAFKEYRSDYLFHDAGRTCQSGYPERFTPSAYRQR